MFNKSKLVQYFLFFYSVISFRIIIFILLNILVGLLDGIGLAMFVPLLSIIIKPTSATNAASLSGVTQHLDSFFHFLNTALNLHTILITLIIIFSLKGAIRYLQVRYTASIRLYFISKIRLKLLALLENTTYSGFLKLDAGQIQNNFLTEITRLFGTMTNFFSTIQFACLLLTYTILALGADFRITIILILSSLITNIIYRRIFKNTYQASLDIPQLGHRLSSYMLQAISHFKYLKSTNYFQRYAIKLKKLIIETEKLVFKMGEYQAKAEGVKEPIVVVIICFVIFIQVKFIKGNTDYFFVSILLLYRALTELSNLRSSWQFFMQGTGSIKSIEKFIVDLKSNQEAVSSKDNEITTIDNIQLKNIALNYNSLNVFKDINLEINQPKCIAFVGESGAGKTSLANIIMGITTPTEGDVFINNFALTSILLKQYRNQIGYIAQDAVIFNDSIFNNVSFFDAQTEENMKKFWEVIEMASLLDFVQGLTNKEQSILGDNGMLISGGQKQRISIARELYKSPSLLILDEATSALDSETENIIVQSIEQLKGQCIIIVIAHRLSTIRNVDKIYLLDNKSIVAEGTYEELKIKSPKFKKMIAAQLS